MTEELEKNCRLFIGIDIPQETKEHISKLQNGLDGVLWSDEHNMHITLRFLGPCTEQQLEEVKAALKTVSFEPITLGVKGVGFWRPEIMWVGVEAPPALAELKESIDGALNHLEFNGERHSFTPHITFGRLKNKEFKPEATAYIEQIQDFSAPSFEVECFRLYESFTTPNGPMYRVKEEYC